MDSIWLTSVATTVLMLRLLVVLMGLLMIYTTNSYRLRVHEGEETLLTLIVTAVTSYVEIDSINNFTMTYLTH